MKYIRFSIIFLNVFLVFQVLFKFKVSSAVILQSQISLDTSIVREDTSYNLPEEIIVVPIFQNYNDDLLSIEDRYKGLFYYCVQKLGFSDIPFHYVMGEDGAIYKGNLGGDERQIAIEGIGSRILVIGYMTKSSANTFTGISRLKLEELILQVANKNSINPSKIKVKGISFKRDPESRTVSILSNDVFGTWNADIETIKNSLANKYAPANKSYQIKIDGFELSAVQAQPGSILSGKVTISNLNNSGMYAGTNSEIIISKVDSSASAFYINNVWISQNETSIMKDDEVLLPLKTQEFSFNISIPLYEGDYSEKFKFKLLSGETLGSEILEIKVNIAKTDKKIVEILDTGAGILNVRESASSVANVLTNVSVGQRFFLLEDAGNGWIKIDLGNGKSGWVASWFTKEVN